MVGSGEEGVGGGGTRGSLKLLLRAAGSVVEVFLCGNGRQGTTPAQCEQEEHVRREHQGIHASQCHLYTPWPCR